MKCGFIFLKILNFLAEVTLFIFTVFVESAKQNTNIFILKATRFNKIQKKKY